MIRTEALRRARVLVRQPTRTLARLAIGLLCAAPPLFGTLRPFAPACTAASLACGWHPLLALTAPALGVLLGASGPERLAALIGCGLICLLHFTVGRLLPLPRDASGRREGRCALLAFLGALCQCLPALHPALYSGLARAATGALCAALLSPVLMNAFALNTRRTRLMPDERIALLSALVLMLGGLTALPRIGPFLGGTGRALMVLAGGWLGPGFGSAAGAAAGLSLALPGGGLNAYLPLSAALALSGLLCGTMRRLGRPAMGLMLTLAMGLGLAVYGAPLPMSLLNLLPALAAAALFCLLPAGLRPRLMKLMDARTAHLDPGALSVRARAGAAQQAEALARAFEGLQGEYAAQDRATDEVGLMARLRTALCEGCADYDRCWQGERAQAGRLLCRMMSEAISGRAPTRVSDMPPDATRHCRRSTQIDQRVRPVLDAFLAERRQAARRGELRAQVSRQMGEAANLMRRMGEQLSRPLTPDEDCARLCEAALERAGLPSGEVLALWDGSLEITVTLPGRLWSAEAARSAAQALSEELGMPLLCRLCPEDQSMLRIVEKPTYRLESAMLQRGAGGSVQCGDSCMIRELPGGRLLLALSDGMGTGAKAQERSRRTLDLAERFLRASMPLDSAIAILNDALMAHGEEMFATLDLCLVDLCRGSALFLKLGAARSYLIRGRCRRVIEGGRLPVGIVRGVTARREQVTLAAGDVLLMFSDGVMDELQAGRREQLDALLEQHLPCAPQELARALLENAAQRGHADDCTVIAARLEPFDAKKTDAFGKNAGSQKRNHML